MDKDKSIDISKGLAMMLVVLGHALVPEIRECSKVAENIYDFIYSFHMFFFFMISGYLFQNHYTKYRTNKKQFLNRKINQLIVPYAFITFVEYALLITITYLANFPNKEFTVGSFFMALVFNYNHFDTHLWFIYVLFYVFIINLLITKKKVLLCIFIAIMMFRNFMAIPITLLLSIIKYCVPFLIGRIYYDYRKKILDYYTLKKTTVFIILLIGILGLIGVNKIIDIMQTYEQCWWLSGIIQEIQYIAGFIGTIMLLLLGDVLKQYKLKILSVISKYNYEIYLLHQPFITAGISKVFYKITGNWFVSVGSAFILGLGVSIFISVIILKYSKPLSIMLLGKDIHCIKAVNNGSCRN